MAEQLLPQIGKIDALVCASDLLAIGAIRTFIENQVRVPDDVAVIGWDNIVDGRYLSPSLSSVATDLDLLAVQTFEALISRIQGNRDPARVYTVPHELAIRESSGNAGAFKPPRKHVG
jgi:DNA-binding LacI/PurR family transcriptional regulator